MVPVSYEGSDNEEEVEIVPTNIDNNNYYNVVSDVKSDE